jgi:hypothetical protein
VARRQDDRSVFFADRFRAFGKALELLDRKTYRYIAIEFGEDAAEERRICPGEANCEDFKSAAGKTREAKERNMCRGCAAFPSKINPENEVIENRIETAIKVASYWRQRRNSGFEMDESKMTSLVYEAILLLDKYTEYFERKLRVLNNRYLEMLLKKPGL